MQLFRIPASGLHDLGQLLHMDLLSDTELLESGLHLVWKAAMEEVDGTSSLEGSYDSSSSFPSSTSGCEEDVPMLVWVVFFIDWKLAQHAPAAYPPQMEGSTLSLFVPGVAAVIEYGKFDHLQHPDG